MSFANTTRSYGSVTKTFHWLTALLILAEIPLGLIANGLAEQLRDPAHVASTAVLDRTVLLFSLHKTLGVTIFFVALARILWAFTQPKPGLLNPEHRLEAKAAETVHWLLYGSLILVPVTGWLDHAASVGFAPILWPFGQDLPLVPKSAALSSFLGNLHVIFMRVLVVAILLHVAGALKHYLIDRDKTLQRMLPGEPAAPEPPAQRSGLVPPLAAVAIWIAALSIGLLGGLEETGAQPELAAVQSDWSVIDGDLGIVITQMGSEVEGSFADWTAAIQFTDPAVPGPAGHVDVQIAIASLSLGSVTAQALGPDFFDADQFPIATFSGDIDKTETGYTATGPLAIRGQEVIITLPFDLEKTGDTVDVTGQTTVGRLDFGIGDSMRDAGTLGLKVAIQVSLKAKPGAPND